MTEILPSKKARQARESDLLVWLDMEMTGLVPEHDRVLEVAVIITTPELDQVDQGREWVLRQDQTVLDQMDEWNQKHHTMSGLLEKVRTATLTERDVEMELLSYLELHGSSKGMPLAGNSVHQDRMFLRLFFPAVNEYLHYRNVDVSSVKELIRRWNPSVYDQRPRKKSAHRALDDLRESIAELRYYRETAFR